MVHSRPALHSVRPRGSGQHLPPARRCRLRVLEGGDGGGFAELEIAVRHVTGGVELMILMGGEKVLSPHDLEYVFRHEVLKIPTSLFLLI